MLPHIKNQCHWGQPLLALRKWIRLCHNPNILSVGEHQPAAVLASDLSSSPALKVEVIVRHTCAFSVPCAHRASSHDELLCIISAQTVVLDRSYAYTSAATNSNEHALWRRCFAGLFCAD